MSRHSCPRCGYESRRPRWGAWADRHPVAAALLALPTLYTLAGVILAYPWFSVPLLVVAAEFLVEHRQRRRAAIAARADYEHRKLLLAAVFPPQRFPITPSRGPRPRGADHWSPTQPIREASRS